MDQISLSLIPEVMIPGIQILRKTNKFLSIAAKIITPTLPIRIEITILKKVLDQPPPIGSPIPSQRILFQFKIKSRMIRTTSLR